MKTFADPVSENKNPSVSNGFSQKKNSQEATAEGKPNGLAFNSPQAEHALQLQAMADDFTGRQEQPSKQVENKSSLPDNLKTGVEQLSGFAMDDVTVHYDSSKPAQLQAHAYAQGSNIHLGPGQEKHLPHEAWHVVQQKQGRVRPTMQMKSIGINDDMSLEREADQMGDKALEIQPFSASQFSKTISVPLSQDVIQGVFTLKYKEGKEEEKEEEINEKGDIQKFLERRMEYETLTKEFDEVIVRKAITKAENDFLILGEKTPDLALSTLLVMIRRYCKSLETKDAPELENLDFGSMPDSTKLPGNISEVQKALEGGDSLDAAINLVKDEPKYFAGIKLSNPQCITLINKIKNLSQPTTPLKKSALILQVCQATDNFALEFEDGKSLIHILVEIGERKGVQAILGKGANINAKTTDNNSPLHIAVSNKNGEVCQLLLNQGAEINAKNKNSSTPLHLAAGTGNLKLCQLLIEYGADISAIDQGGESPIAKATASSMEVLFNPLADLFLKKGQIAPLTKNLENSLPIEIFASMIWIQNNGKVSPELATSFQSLSKIKTLFPLIEAMTKLADRGFKIIGSNGPNISNALVTSSRGQSADGLTPRVKDNLRIYFTAGGGKPFEAQRGTIMHESTHHMMNLIFKNYKSEPAPSAPFFLDQESNRKEEFDKIVQEIEVGFKPKEKINSSETDISPEKIISEVFNYKKEEWAGELIVRVPEILATFPDKGEEWLSENVPKLLNYWNEYIVPKLNSFN